MRKVLLLSPHYDDAVLSAGQFMAGRPDTEVLTLFNYWVEPGVQTAYDAKCGFNSADEAVKTRKIENEEATALLNATCIDLNFADAQYGSARMEDQFICNRIIDKIKGTDYEFIVAPLGLGHPDHEQTTDVAILLNKKLNMPLYLWEDLPLRVIEPEIVTQRLNKYKLKEKALIGSGSIASKIRSISCYRSQVGTGILDPYVMYAPERFWKYE